MRIVATAGHVDHGKSTLVTFLTGTDPDRLPEEKRRGLTIDLGFAATTLPSGQEVGFVDVPGHARFVGNMLAGVGATDACLFVVAATEGWRPQSEEHLRILELLGAHHGLVALTKVGLVDGERRQLAEAALADHLAGSFLAAAPVVAVDVPAGIGTSGAGGLAATLDRVVGSTPAAPDHQRPRLWVDRSFAVKGSGTVVTGSLVGGSLAVGDRLVVEPQGVPVRVRGLQTHGRPLARATPGRRLAVNLAGVGHRDVRRGDALVAPGQWHRCTVLDATLHLLADAGEVGHRGAWVLHLGSGEHAVRLRPLGRRAAVTPEDPAPVRIWLPVPLPLLPGDRFVLRDAGRQRTVGGGEILDVAPCRPASRAAPTLSVDRVVAERGWVAVDELERLTGARRPATVGRWVAAPDALAETAAAVARQLDAAGPLGLDLSAVDERARAVLETLPGVVLDGPYARRAGGGAGDGTAALEDHPFLAALRAAPFAPPAPDGVDRSELRAMERRGLVVERDGTWFAAEAVTMAAAEVRRLLAAEPGGVPVSAIRQALGTTRRFALPLVAHLDATGVTRRRGDLRVAGPRLARAAAGDRAPSGLDRVPTRTEQGAG